MLDPFVEILICWLMAHAGLSAPPAGVFHHTTRHAG